MYVSGMSLMSMAADASSTNKATAIRRVGSIIV